MKAKKLEDLELTDVGKTVELINTWGDSKKTKILMGIKAPRGRCFIFEPPSGELSNKQARAIREFMKYHRGTK